jgi:hypothetical protein
VISHTYKCIFIHIQRTAGSSLESWITGKDWWFVEPQTKHLLASQARRLYAEHWDSYFKFAFVREPADRVLSCLKFADHFGLRAEGGGRIDFSGYHARYGDPVVVEYDQRHYSHAEIASPRHLPGAVYGNILDEPLDFIGRFEHLARDTAFLRDRLALPTPFDQHIQISKTRDPADALNPDTRAHIGRIYARDRERFEY